MSMPMLNSYNLLETNKSKFIFCILFLLFIINPFFCYSQSQEEQKALQDFETIESGNRYVDFLDLGEGKSLNLPVGIKKIIGNMSCVLAISNIKIGAEYGEASCYLKIELPSASTDKKSKYLIFGVQGVKISYTGNFIGDVNLMLLSTHPISLGKGISIQIKGGNIDDENGNLSSETYLTLDCNGDVKEFALSADIIFDKDTFIPTNPKESVLKASFKAVVEDLNNLVVAINIPAFQLKNVPGFIFEVSEATLDFSDSQNPNNFNPDPEYFNKYFTLPDRNLWRGVHVNKFSVTFPSMFNKEDSVSTKIDATQLLIDDNGITAHISAQNLLPLGDAKSSVFSFSVDGFSLNLLANNITGFGFNGKCGIPYLKDEKPLEYKAYISKDTYLLSAEIGKDRKINLLGLGELHLASNSILQIEVEDGKFIPTAILDGSMAINKDMLAMEEIAFTKLRLSAAAPRFSVESAEYGGEVKFLNFPISVSGIKFTAVDDLATLGFSMNINLMSEKISASSGLRIVSEFKGDGGLKYKGLYVDSVKLKKVQLAGFSLDGEIHIVKDDPKYGNYFGGDITARFGALSDKLEVNVKAVFGRKDFRYWYVEGAAAFSPGISIGPVFLNGFLGGAYYKMKYVGGSGIRAYEPNEDCGLGVKAGVNYYIAQNNTISGNALFEMNFSSSGGIRNIMFYGTAEFLKETGNSESMLANMFTAGLGKARCVGQSFTDGLSSSMDGSSMSKEILGAMNLSGVISAYISMNYDFVIKTFDANCAIMINTPGDLIRGAGQNGEAGWAWMHFSPSEWFVHVGTPSNPVGLRIGLGSLYLSTESYFMLGDRLEAPVLDSEVSRILGISPQQADYMKYPEGASMGRGLAFGSRFKFDTGNITFLILYARFMAGIGFDVMLQDMGEYYCKDNPGKPIGLNNWYASGQSYAYLEGELGVKIKFLMINKKISIIKGSAAALLQARLPNPTWVGGYFAVDLNVLGLIKGSMKMKFSFGDACELVRRDGDQTPLDFPIIADLTPKDGGTDVDIFLSPQTTFNVALEEAFETQDDQGDTHTYRVKLSDFYIADVNGNKVPGIIKKGKDGMSASFESHDVLPPYKDMQAFVSVLLEENKGGSWVELTNARETKTVHFKTGDAPQYIPISNIEYCYPVIDQKTFYKGESSSGYVQLVKGQPYLFPEGFDYNTIFVSGKQELASGFGYNASEKRIDYQFPSLANKNSYEIAFVASTKGGVQQDGESTITTYNTIENTELGESYEIGYEQKAAQTIIKDGSLKVLNYNFKTSSFSTFEEKVSVMSFSRGAKIIGPEIRDLFLKIGNNYENFDEIELVGAPTTKGVPLVFAEATLNDDYFNSTINPLLYAWYPMNGISVSRDDVEKIGMPPVRAFYIMDRHSEEGKLPFAYHLSGYYNKDFYDLQTQAANLFARGNGVEQLKPLATKQFPMITPGNYKAKLQYVMPGSKKGTYIIVDYIYWY